MVSSSDLSNAYMRVSGTTMDAAALQARNQFLSLGSWRTEDIGRFVQGITPAVGQAKETMANYSLSYYKEMAGINKKSFTMPKNVKAQLSTALLRKNVVTDRDVWERPMKEMWTSLSKGDDFSNALELGAQRATSIARTEVQLARREAGLLSRKANDNVVGYLRTLSGAESCGLCYVASTQRYTRGDLMPIHPGCDCGEMPIYGDTDVGQIIDQQQLDATHEAVSERFGVQDASARKIDYRKIAIKNHGELGPYLAVKGQKFTKVPKTRLNNPIKAPKKVTATPFKERIEPKLKKLNAQRIADDIKLEVGDVFVPGLKGKAKIQTLGPKTSAHLEAVKAVGKDIDDEIGKRVKKAIGDISPEEIAFAQSQTKLAEELLAKAQVQLEAGIQKQVSIELARIEAQAVATQARLVREGLSKADIDSIMVGTYNTEENLRRAQSFASGGFRSTPLGEKLRKEIKDYTLDITEYQGSLPGNILPGTQKYNQLYAASTKEALEEFRELGKGGPEFIGSQKANDILNEAKQVYPSDWLAKAAVDNSNIGTKAVGRGYFSNMSGEIGISFDKAKGFSSGYATAVHEMGHLFEYTIPGLKELEFAFAHQRAALGTKRTNMGSKEAGFQDQWRNLYTGKDYGYNIDSAYEIFTTGIESVFAGSNMWSPPATASQYLNPALSADAGLDTEFRQFILGVLFGL